MNLSLQGDAFDFDVASHSEKRPAPTPTPGVKGASLRDLYRIKPIPNRSAMRIVVERGTSAVLIRVTRVPADWSATVTQVQVGLR